MNRIALLAPLLIFVVIGAAFAVSLTRDPSIIPSELVNRPMPAFSLPPIEGFDEGLSSDSISGEVALLNVFASWCFGCRVEHPILNQLAQSNEIPIYGLNWKDKPGEGTAWLERYGNPYTRIGDDQSGRVAIDLGVTGAPETYVIDKAGRVRYKHIGPITQDVWDETLEPLIKELKGS